MQKFRLILRRSIWTLALGGTILGLAFLAFYVYDLNVRSQRYVGDLKHAASTLHTRCAALSRRSEQVLILNANGEQGASHADITALRTLAAQVRNELKQFDASTASFTPGPYLPFASEYSHAVALHNRAMDASLQIKEALSKYDTLLTYLDSYDQLSSPLKDELAAFNATFNLDTYANRGGELYATAEKIRIARDAIAALHPPQGLEEVQASEVAAHTHAADGFSVLAAALSPPLDDYIYAAAYRIESATTENEQALALLDQRLGKLPALTDISELPDKVDDY